MVLNAVKYAFTEGKPGRWVPTMGRNRLVGHVDGTNGNVIVKGNNVPRLANIDAFQATLATAGLIQQRGESTPQQVIQVAIIDTTLRPHRFLLGKRVFPANPRPFGSGQHPFRSGHGTFVAGLVVGRAPNAAVTVEATLDEEGRATSWDVANAILKCSDDGAQIINLSLACYTYDGLPPLVFSQAINRLPPDTLVVAAAGNMGGMQPPAQDKYPRLPDLSLAPAWPAALDDVVAVGAADVDGQPASFSPAGLWVDVLAPGVRVPSIFPGGIDNEWPAPDGGYATWSGTSFATAEISGAVAALATTDNLSPRDAYLKLRSGNQNGFIFLTSEI